MLRVNLLNALENAKQETLKIADSTRHPIRKKRALEAYQQACEIRDFLENPSLYRRFGNQRYQHLVEMFRTMIRWLYIRKPKRRRVYSIVLGLYKREYSFDLYYLIKVEQSTEATFKIGQLTGFPSFYGD